MNFSIVVPLFGSESFLTACLKSINDNTENYEIVVVDNGTGYDFSADVIIRNQTNEGFGRACNAGADAATGDLICFLNVDAEVQPGWLPPLVVAFDDPEVVVAGPRIVHPAGDLQTAGLITWHGNGSAGGQEIKEDLPTRDVDGVTGACMVIRKNVFSAMGGFDTDFINGYEDVSLCLTVREMGYRIRFVHESTIIHHESAAGGVDRWLHAAQNVATMNAKWGNR